MGAASRLSANRFACLGLDSREKDIIIWKDAPARMSSELS
jgi:hypothetical protein